MFCVDRKTTNRVSTKVVYEALDSKELVEHPDIDGLIEGLEKRDLKTIASCMGNVLEDVTIPMHPVIEEIKQEMKNAGALNAMMSGSGPTVFGLFETKAAARKAQTELGEGHCKTSLRNKCTWCREELTDGDEL